MNHLALETLMAVLTQKEGGREPEVSFLVSSAVAPSSPDTVLDMKDVVASELNEGPARKKPE